MKVKDEKTDLGNGYGDGWEEGRCGKARGADGDKGRVKMK